MRIRTIKPEFFTHEGLYETERETGLPVRIAFAGLWCASDREGRFKWEPRRLGIQILPYDQVDFSRVLDALATRGFLVKYRVCDAYFGWIPGFPEHQVVNNKEGASKLPCPHQEGAEIEPFHTRIDAKPTREPREDHAIRKEGKGKEGKGTIETQASPWLVSFGIEIPEALRTPQCMEAVKKWLQYKAERKESYKRTGLEASMTKWAREFNAATFPLSVENSIANGWRGIFPPRDQGQAQPEKLKRKPGQEWMDDPNDWRHSL